MDERDRRGPGSHPADAPHPEDDRKPDTPAEITAPSWKYVLRTTMREFTADGCMDLAGNLTYRTVLAVFPALVALVSILSLFGQSGSTVSGVMSQAEELLPADVWSTVESPLEAVLTAPAPGIGLVLGLLTALWTASSYIKAFGRAMNQIHDVPEGRGFIKFNLQMYLLTALVLLLGAVALMIFVLSGSVAQSVGEAIGLGSTAVTIWEVAKWVVLAGIVVFIVALLYYATPNVKQPKFRWMSIGAGVAILVAVLASAGFFFYVVNFGSYNATYGALAGVIILLLWIFIVNTVLLFGAEVDSEVERGRELQAGLPAEVNLQLPARDTTASDKKEEKFQEDVERARNLRMSAGRTQESVDAEASGAQQSDAGREGEGERPASEEPTRVLRRRRDR